MTKDDIGERGQWLFCLLMTELCGRDLPYFRPRYLGDKYPTFDFIVELVDRPSYLFFVQVKCTTSGYTDSPRRLRVRVDPDDIDRMVACPAPTYVVGIDSPGRRGFLLSVNEPRGRVASLTTEFALSCDALGGLNEEVKTFWMSRDMSLVGSKFLEVGR